MNIDKLFKNLNINKNLVFYLFEHRDKTIHINEIEEFCKENTLEVLENLEIIEQSEDKLFLDGRVVNFLEEYLDASDNIEISIISEIIESLKHKIDIIKEHKSKQKAYIPKIRRELKKCNFVMFKNLDKLRIHVDQVYKSIDEFELKIKELHYYKLKLEELKNALNNFDKFIQLYYPILKSFYNSELNLILEAINQNKIALNKSLIPLTQDVIEYINKAISKNIFIEKIAKLKEHKDNLELKQRTNIEERLDKFDIFEKPIKIFAALNSDIKNDDHFYTMLQNISSKAKLKVKQTTPIRFSEPTIKKEFLNINELDRQFSSSNLSLIEFLHYNDKFQNKTIIEISEIYCKMLLLYENRYNIDNETISINNIKFKKVFYEHKVR
jgi:hypothetical protein